MTADAPWQWIVACPCCGHRQAILWQSVAPGSAAPACGNCGGEVTAAAVALGSWMLSVEGEAPSRLTNPP